MSTWSGMTSDWFQLKWDRNVTVTPVLVFKSCGHSLSLLLTTCSHSISPQSHTAPPSHLCCTFRGVEVRQRFSWPLLCCFVSSLWVLAAVKWKKADRKSVPGLTWVCQEGIKQLEGSWWWALSLQTQNKQKQPFPLMVGEWLTSGSLSLPNIYGKVNVGKNLSSESCGTGSRKETKTFVLAENVSPERWRVVSADRAGQLPCRSAAAAMDLKESLKLERQLLQRYCLCCVSCFPGTEGNHPPNTKLHKAWKSKKVKVHQRKPRSI